MTAAADELYSLLVPLAGERLHGEIEGRRRQAFADVYALVRRIPRGRGKAPEAYRAADRVDGTRLRSLSDEVRSGVTAMRPEMERLGGVRGRFRHPVFGYLTPTEWLRFMAIHNDHHLRIMRDVSEAL